jgi:anti-sigma regulatory factor (Ser/Thr protein kinase)
MTTPTAHGMEIRQFIIQSVPEHPRDLVAAVGERFGITRQAVNRYVRDLVEEGLLIGEGKTSRRRYSLAPLRSERFQVPLAGLEEDRLWRTRVARGCGPLPDNVRDIWHYAFTEMVNNAIDHSNGRTLTIAVDADALRTRMRVRDDGIGIFRKIQVECGLEDERHAILELAKGKLTTDPERHTGEGIFFTSRLVDEFAILSGDVHFSHDYPEDEDRALELEGLVDGTLIVMALRNDSPRRSKDVFDRFASEEDDYGFTRTVVPVRLAQQGSENLVSRSQAKRLLARLDRFKTVVLDFSDVREIGQAFADEIFRVFAHAHPEIELRLIHAGPEVQKMISRARSRDQ